MFTSCPGYTAKVAGTEHGVKEPQPTFSACFGAPFLPLPPAVTPTARRQARRARLDRSGSSTPAGPAVSSARASGCRSYGDARVADGRALRRARRRRVPDGRRCSASRCRHGSRASTSSLLDPRSTGPTRSHTTSGRVSSRDVPRQLRQVRGRRRLGGGRGRASRLARLPHPTRLRRSCPGVWPPDLAGGAMAIVTTSSQVVHSAGFVGHACGSRGLG